MCILRVAAYEVDDVLLANDTKSPVFYIKMQGMSGYSIKNPAFSKRVNHSERSRSVSVCPPTFYFRQKVKVLEA